MPYFVMDPPEELKALFKAEQWEVLRPGVLQREVVFHGVTLRERVMCCQDCGDEDAMVSAPMLRGDLWRQLYPKNGVACGPCMQDRLGRRLQKVDLSRKGTINYGWLQNLEATMKPYHVQRWPNGDREQAKVVDPGPYTKEQGRARAQEMSRGIKGDSFIALPEHMEPKQREAS